MRPAAFTFMLLGAAVLAGPALGSTPDRFHSAAGDSVLGGHTDVPYTTAEGKDIVLDWYRDPRASASERLPAIVFVNTLAGRSMRTHALYRGWAATAMAHGMVAVLPDAAPDFDAGLDALLAHLQAHATELGIDPERIGVYAASANVSRTLPAMADPRRQHVRALALYYGMSDSLVFRSDLPLLIVRAGLDRPGMNAGVRDLVQAALLANAPVTVLNLPAAHHGFETSDRDEVSRGAVVRTMEWMKAALEPAHQTALRAGASFADAAAAMQRGDAARAAEAYGRALGALPADARRTVDRLSYAEALLAARRIPEARQQFEQLRGSGLGPRDLGLPAARAAIADGDSAGAVAWIASIPRQFRPATLASEPEFRVLAGRPDFRALFE